MARHVPCKNLLCLEQEPQSVRARRVMPHPMASALPAQTSPPRSLLGRLKHKARTPLAVLSAWSNDQCLRLGASIAFYSIFSLAPLLAMAVMVAGIAFGVDAARSQIVSQVGGLIGSGSADTIENMLDTAMVSETRQWTGAIVGFVTLFVGATGVFLELRNALDTINKESTEIKHGLSWMVKARLISFALVLAVGFVALVSLALSAALSAFAAWLGDTMPVLATVVLVLDTLVSLAIISGLFMMLLRWLPSIQPRRVSLWPGALLSAILFVVGKHLVGLYLGREGFTDAYGAAGSLVIVLMWVYYCSQALLIGAEYNKVRADRIAENAGNTAERQQHINERDGNEARA
ncbi:MAG TPA: YihY/virulence factor BrkB family protein [Burkholderiales bacterium]|nr:YihY/virulence factor BrkB family protein [Burkholderiales bacterium]